MELIVLAGGLGTRLSSVLPNTPKALAPIGSSQDPFLKFQIDNWISQGVSSFIFLLGHQSSQIINFLDLEKDRHAKTIIFKYVVENEPLGTGGSIKNAIKKLNLSGDLYITNADTWLSSGLSKIKDATVPAIAVVHIEDTARFGRVHFSDNFLVTSFQEKIDFSKPGYINAGLFKLNAQDFKEVNLKNFSVEQEILTKLAENQALNALLLDTYFIDIGIPKDYIKFSSSEHKRR